MVSGSCRLALYSLPALLFVSGCELLLSTAECPDLDDACPNLECDDYKQDRDGCSICECAEDSEPVVCLSDAQCPEGQGCDTVNYCERDPACEGQSDCPAVCFGRCVDGPSTCRTDADCAAGETCLPFGNARPAPPPDEGDQAMPAECMADSDCPAGMMCDAGMCMGVGEPPAEGVCVSNECDSQGAIDLPACPPGTVASIDFAIDPCGVPVCVPVDGCSELDPETCRNTRGCEVFLEDCCGGTEPAGCDCAPLERCGPTDDCASLPPDQCLQNPACELVDVTTGGGEGGMACEVCDEQGNCVPCDADPIAPPPAEQMCVPRQTQGGCLSDADCAPGEACALIESCATGCEVGPDGQESCFEECWVEAGQCVPVTSSCWDIFDPDVCASTPGCELIGSATDPAPPPPCPPDDPNCSGERPIAMICQPTDTTCLDDSECPAGQRCEIVESCPPCDPSNPDDLGCFAPCYLEGRCVDGVPPPPACTVDADCGAGGNCILVEVCDCAAPAGADCAPECRQEGVCVYENVACFSDAECGGDEFCDFSQGCFAGPQALVACQGVCMPIVTDPPPDGAYCLGDAECPIDMACINHDALCRDNPSSDVEACWGWCVGGCGDALTPAQDPATGQCIVFNDTCIPPEWTRVDMCM